MKKILILFLCMFISVFALLFADIPSFSPSVKDTPDQSTADPSAVAPFEPPTVSTDTGNFSKALWISQFDLCDVYVSNGKQRDKGEFCELVGNMLDNCRSLGFDTVIVQARPNGDSIYPSKLFPASKYAVGKYGNEFSYDPFGLIVSLAKLRGLSVHAWINPLRLMTKSEAELLSGEEFSVIKWWESDDTRGKYVKQLDGRLYLDPAYPEVRELIAEGAAELLSLYRLDGIHMDDYFYPHGITEDFDKEAYASFSCDKKLSDWRRDNISELVGLIYKKVKSTDENALFGISPGGNLDTVFNTDYADVYRWCKEDGYIDYICPQIYFGLRHETYAFGAVFERWERIVKDTDVSFFVGITFGKAESASLGKEDKYAGTGKNEWINSKRVLADCLEILKGNEALDGIAVFCYQYFFDPVSGEKNENTKEELQNFLPVWKEF